MVRAVNSPPLSSFLSLPFSPLSSLLSPLLLLSFLFPLSYFHLGKQEITTLPAWSYDYSSRSRLSTEETRRGFWDYYLTPEYVSSSCLLLSFFSSHKLVSSAAIQYVSIPIYRLWRSLTLQPIGISVCPLYLFSSLLFSSLLFSSLLFSSFYLF